MALLQERVLPHPWRVLVACALLNKTTGKQAEPALWELFHLWPWPDELMHAGPLLEEVLRPLGLWRRRAATLRALSTAYERLAPDPDGAWPHPRPAREVIRTIPGVGQYAEDSWDLFVEGRIPPLGVQDKELRKYVSWLNAGGALLPLSPLSSSPSPLPLSTPSPRPPPPIPPAPPPRD